MLERSYALVTGASSGMGYCYAQALAQRGYHLLMVSNEEAIHDKAAIIAQAHPELDIQSLVINLGTPTAAKELYDYCIQHHLCIEVLINNAGVYHDRDYLADSEAFNQLILYLHVVTPSMLCYYLGQDMVKRHKGYILNMSSITDRIAVQRLGTYGSTKAYLSFFSRFFACKYIVDSKDDVSDKDMRSDETIKALYTDAEKQIEQRNYLGFRLFGTLLNAHPEYITVLDKVLDVFYEFDYSDSQQVIFKQMVPVWEKDSTNVGDDFYCNTHSKISHVKLIVLAAVIEYIDAFPSFDKEMFNEWMRFVWNVTENTNIDSLTPASSLIRKFSKVARFVAGKTADGQSFYNALSQWKDDGVNERENRAVLEEVEKAKRVAEDEDWLPSFKDAEQHPFFKGMVLFFYLEGMPKADFIKSVDAAKLMFDENGIAPAYRDKHILIRAIASRFNDWERKLKEKYITERAETHKYLKNILAADEDVRSMLAHALSFGNESDIKDCLQSYIDNPDEIVPWENAGGDDELHIQMAFDRLRKDVKLYDWAAKVEAEKKKCFRVYWFDGLIMFAIPRTQYDRVALDTERAKMAGKLCLDFGFEFTDSNQKSMFKEYGDCFDKEVELYKEVSDDHTINVWFSSKHELYIQVTCRTIKLAKDLQEQIPDSQICDDNHVVELPILNHSTSAKSYKKLSQSLQTIFDII